MYLGSKLHVKVNYTYSMCICIHVLYITNYQLGQLLDPIFSIFLIICLLDVVE